MVGYARDRIAYATSWSNAVFDSAMLTMPSGGLCFNVCVPGVDAPGCAYAMAELIDDRHQVVAGYAREGCIMQAPLDHLRW